MSITPKLVFFNKQGFPYNFTLNDGIWTGKIFFDPNSTDIFKSLSLYTLENVDPIEIDDEFNILNNELFNESGMTLSSGGYYDEKVLNIVSVNDSGSFYSKWVYGKNFHRKFPVGTVISFSGNADSGATNGEQDFASGSFFTVLRTIRNAIMIATQTSNDNNILNPNAYTFVFNPNINDFYVTSHNCISLLDPNEDLDTTFNITDRLSVVGSSNNDGVYELIDIGYTTTNIYDFELSGLTYGDTMNVNLTLLTERPLLYNGNIYMELSGSTLFFTFDDGLNSNITLGTQFICEDENWNHLLDSNEYTVTDIVTEEEIVEESVTFIKESFEQDDGQKGYNFIVRLSDDFDIQPGWLIRFDYAPTTPLSTTKDVKNSKLVKRVIDIKSGATYYDIYLDSEISEITNVNYRLTRVLRRGDIDTVIVQPSINYVTYNGYAKVMSTSNILRYNQQIPSTGSTLLDDVTNTIDIFINKFRPIFMSNGIDIYRKDSVLIFEGMYGGQNEYFNIDLFINNTSISIEDNYSTGSITSLLNLILRENSITYERLNMSNNYDQPFYADIILNLFDDAQDYGFELTINGSPYYISFSDDSGTTSNTHETRIKFINKYETTLYKNGINIYSGRTLVSGEYEEHLYINGQKSNVNIFELNVRVNRNSSYEIVKQIPNNYMLLASNKIESSTINFFNFGLSTGMILSVSGSTYPLNNKEYNIIGISSNAIQLSYQGPMGSENNVFLSLKTRDFLRRPRESNDTDIYYRFRWEDDLEKSIFLYDLSGENLKPWGNNPLYEYVGPKPLSADGDLVFLNKEPNKNINQVSVPYKQQTVFDELNYKLQRFDDLDASILPNPIQTFIGYNTKKEGVNQRNLIVERDEQTIYKGSTSNSNMYFEIKDNIIRLVNSTNSFLELGFKTNRYLRLKLVDERPFSQLIFENFEDYHITEVTNTTIKVSEKLINFTTENEDFRFELIQLPERIGYFRICGETESEDERLEANLKLIGVSIRE
ncbi:MAG: hypothetical protein ACOC2W_03035, partial [bacterium]